MNEKDAREFLSGLMNQINAEDKIGVNPPYFYVIQTCHNLKTESGNHCEIWQDNLFFLTLKEAQDALYPKNFGIPRIKHYGRHRGKEARIRVKSMGCSINSVNLFEAIGALCEVYLKCYE